MKSEILKRFEDMEDHRVEGRIIHPLRNIIFITVVGALCCQVKIAERIVGKGADYVLALKMNQSTLRRDADLSFDKLPCCAEITTEETDHGRVEVSCNCLSINKCCFGVPFFAKKSASKSLPPHFFRNRDAVGFVNTNCYWG